MNVNIDVPLGEPLERRVKRTLLRIFRAHTEGLGADAAARESANELYMLALALGFAGYNLPVSIPHKLFELACMLMPEDRGDHYQLGTLIAHTLQSDGDERTLFFN